MPRFRAKRNVYHSADQMFDLVADIESYPEFVPLCQEHAVVSRKTSGAREILMTEMTVAYKIFRETIRSRDTLDRSNGRILVESINGPLRRLRSLWTFEPRADDSCDVGFDLSYEFASPMLALLARGVLDAAFSRYIQAFERRADEIYGRPMRPPFQRQHGREAGASRAAGDARSSGRRYTKVAPPSRAESTQGARP